MFLVRTVPLALIVLAAVLIVATGWHKKLSFAEFVARRDLIVAYVEAHRVTAIMQYAGFYALAVALSLPGALFLTLLGGFLFGWLVGGAIAVLAATSGALIVFLAARTALGDLLAAKAGPRLSRLRDGFRDDAASYMLFLRLVPIFPFWLVNLAPAIAGVTATTFLWTTLVGIMPATFAIAVAGAGLDDVVAAQKAAYHACLAAQEVGCKLQVKARALLTPGLMAALAALGVVALIPPLAKLLINRRG